MDYKLAKKLKDAGFPLKNSVWDKYLYIGEPSDEDFEREWNKGKETFSPTLSELIEACGDKFFRLEYLCGNRKDYRWFAQGMEGVVGGKTPEIAVAKLWLKLNKK